MFTHNHQVELKKLNNITGIPLEFFKKIPVRNMDYIITNFEKIIKKIESLRTSVIGQDVFPTDDEIRETITDWFSLPHKHFLRICHEGACNMGRLKRSLSETPTELKRFFDFSSTDTTSSSSAPQTPFSR